MAAPIRQTITSLLLPLQTIERCDTSERTFTVIVTRSTPNHLPFRDNDDLLYLTSGKG